MSKYNYDLVFENTARENKIIEVLDKINDNIARYDVKIDACDRDNDGVYCLIDFDNRNGENDVFVLRDTKEVLDEVNVDYYIDDYPDIDECGVGFSYPVYIKFEGENYGEI